MATLAAEGVSTFLELGAKPTLIGMGRQCLSQLEARWLPSLRPGSNDWQVILSSLAKLHCSGTSQHQAGQHAEQTNFAALHCQLLAKQNDDEESDCGDNRN